MTKDTIPLGGAFGATRLMNIFHTGLITIDYGMSLEAMIAAGEYDWKNGNITAEKFPVEGTGIKKFRTRLFHFDRNTSSEDAVAAMKEEGLEPATHVHGLAFGATFRTSN